MARPGSLQVMLVELHQGEADPEVVAAPKRFDGTKIVELDGGGLRLLQRAGQQCCPSESGVDPLGLVPGPLGICLGGGLEMPAGHQRLDGGVASAHPHPAGIGHQVKESVDDRLEDAGEETDGEAIDGPERADQLEGLGVGAGQRQENRDYGPHESNRPHHQADEAKRLLRPPVGSADRVVRPVRWWARMV